MAVAVGGELRIARCADGDMAVVAELREGAAFAALADVAGRAVAFARIVEGFQAACLLRAQLGLATQVGVVFAVIGIELARILLEHFQRQGGLVESLRGAAEDVVAEQAPEARGGR